MARRRHTMTKVRWLLLIPGTLVLVLVFLFTDDVTARFTAGMAWGFGGLILGASERIIVRTRNDPATRLANWRAGELD